MSRIRERGAGGWLDPRAALRTRLLERRGQAIRPGQSFSAAFIVGYFDSIDQMYKVYDSHKGHTALEVTPASWRLK